MSLFVKKFGGSLLKTTIDFENIAHYLSVFYQQKHKLVVVVSAPAGLTDTFIKEVQNHHFPKNNEAFNLLLSLGEQKSCALLGLALAKKHIPFSIFSGSKVGIKKTNSNHWEIDKETYRSAIKTGIVIVSGFQALNEFNQVFVFERGGSDLTALILAHQLNANRCELYKDVGSIFDRDPKKNKSANPFSKLTFEDLETLIKEESVVVQSQALAYAKNHQQDFWVKNMDTQGTFITN